MTLKEIIELFGLNEWGVIILIILSLVQISPIKVNPLSWIAKMIGRAVNKELYDKVDSLEKAINSVSESQKLSREEWEEDKALSARIRILQFNDELLREHRHSKESFDQTLADITFYEDYCEDHVHFENDKAVMAIKNVRRCYEKCLIDKDFL